MEKLPIQHWYNDKLKWYGVRIPLNHTWTLTRYREVLDWIQANVDNPLRHARWRIDKEYIEFRFRHERDYLRFTLSW